MSKPKPKSFDDRKGDEAKEGYTEVKTGNPDGRLQGEKQVLKPDELGVTASSIPGTEEVVTTSNMAERSATKLKSKIKVRPDVSVDELKNTQVGGVPLTDSTGVLRSVAGVSSLSPADDTSKIPYSGGEYRPGTRYGKKRSEDLFEMDNTITEQVVPQVDDSLDLREAPHAKQGYNGRKQFKQTRSKKNATYSITAGGTTYSAKLPQQLLNEASVDFMVTDKVVYTAGQIAGNLGSHSGYPQVQTSADGASPVTSAVVMEKGNYKPTALNITLSNGKISAIAITEDKYVAAADPITRDQANMNWQVDANNVAKTMVKLQKELGRETTAEWSPLGYVINQPYEYNMLMHDIEATTGAIMAAAYRSAVSSLAFQRNILAKDGVNPQTNAIKMILEGYRGNIASNAKSVFKNIKFDLSIWNKAEYAKGSAAAIIAMFDTTGKYSTKADLLGLQRSFGLHLAQADNNINPLHCKPAFIKALDKAHMFSTIDGNYNPMLPIIATKLIKIVNPLSLNVFLWGWKHPETLTAAERADVRRDELTGTYSIYMYTYKDIRNTYDTRVQHPVVEGLLKWLLKHESALAKAYGDSANISIPFEFNMQAPNMLSFMLCSAAQEVAWERNIIFRDILFAGEQRANYIWDDLEGLDKLNPLYSSQLKIGRYTEPLVMGKLAPDSAVREFWGTHMNLSDRQNGVGVNTKGQFFLPWYFNERALTNSFTANEGFNNEPSAFNMTIPSIRDGVRHEYVDLIKSMEERDIRLSLDRWCRIPFFDVATIKGVLFKGTTVQGVFTEHNPVTTSATLNSLIKLAGVRYEANSDARVAVVYQVEDGGTEYNLNQHSLYSVPKELGFIEDCYDGYKLITGVDQAGNPLALSISETAISPIETLDGCELYSGFSPLRLISYRVDSDSDSNGAIDRSAALSQVFYTFCAAEDANSTNAEYIAKIGVVPCLSAQAWAEYIAMPYHTLNGDSAASNLLDINVVTRAPQIWSMIQRFFMPVNKFENCFTVDVDKTAFDPLETSYYFGVCGTLASDFTQDVLERLDVYDQLGLDYTEDVFMHDSPLFR